MRHIGIIGASSEGAALCYRTICNEAQRTLGEFVHPEVSLHNFPLRDYVALVEDGDWVGVGRLLLESAEKLRTMGAEVFICAANTPHQGLDLVREEAQPGWLHIADEVARAAAEDGVERLAVLGTRPLMEGPVYPQALAKVRIDSVIPTAPEREQMHRYIFDELVHAKFERSTRRWFVKVIDRLGREEGCDAVAFACTEIPLLLDEGESPLPSLDSTRLLARAAVREATKEG